MTDEQLWDLAAFFPPEDIEWKPITVSKKTNKGLAAAYITNRGIMQRLDEVCGPANWKNEFKAGPDGGILCGISIRVSAEDWVCKWDGAENTDIEPVKGGLSSAMRRAAVQWGIGRYLYDFPMQWVRVDERGRFAETPRIPKEYLPANVPEDRAGNARVAHAPEDATDEAMEAWNDKYRAMLDIAAAMGFSKADVLKVARARFNATALEDLDAAQMQAIIDRMKGVEDEHYAKNS